MFAQQRSSVIEKHLGSTEESLKFTVVVSLVLMALCDALFTQFHESTYPLKQRLGSLLQLGSFPWTLPQMLSQNTLLKETVKAQTLRNTSCIKYLHFLITNFLFLTCEVHLQQKIC